LVVDGTGVGRPVVDLLREPDIDCELAPILITGGAHVRKEAGMWNVPKRDLIAEVQMLLEQRRLTISGQLPRAKTLIDELMAMRMRLSAEGREQYGVWREGSHDDLALAVAMACWRAKGEEVPVGEQGTGRVLSM